MNELKDMDGDAAVVAKLGANMAEAHRPGAADEDGIPFVVVPDGFRVAGLGEYLPAPARVAQNFVAEDIDSFVEYVDGFKTPTTMLFGSRENACFAAVIDHHTNVDGVNQPGWCKHTARLELKETPEFEGWKGLEKQNLSQEEFAFFVEDRLKDITEPVAADLLELVKSIETHSNASFKSTINLDNGNVDVAFMEEVQTGSRVGSINFPSEIRLGLRPWRGADAYEVKLRLRIRVRDGKLTIRFEFKNLDAVLDHAFSEVRAKIEEKTERNILLGRPNP